MQVFPTLLTMKIDQDRDKQLFSILISTQFLSRIKEVVEHLLVGNHHQLCFKSKGIGPCEEIEGGTNHCKLDGASKYSCPIDYFFLRKMFYESCRYVGCNMEQC